MKTICHSRTLKTFNLKFFLEYLSLTFYLSNLNLFAHRSFIFTCLELVFLLPLVFTEKHVYFHFWNSTTLLHRLYGGEEALQWGARKPRFLSWFLQSLITGIWLKPILLSFSFYNCKMRIFSSRIKVHIKTL